MKCNPISTVINGSSLAFSALSSSLVAAAKKVSGFVQKHPKLTTLGVVLASVGVYFASYYINSSITPRFFIERPADEYWNTGMGATVIKAVETPPNKWGTVRLKVLAPDSFPWEYIVKDAFIECSGPARKLNFHDYVHLIHNLIPDRPLPMGWKG